jgi:hypothetical protein
MSREIKTPIDGVRPLTEIELDSVNGGLNALMLPLAVVYATLAAMDSDWYWIPYFSR